jgi:symplekin
MNVHSIRNPNDAPLWQLMTAIKSNILRRMDNELPGVRICCLRFVERVVQTQTPGVIADPRVSPAYIPVGRDQGHLTRKQRPDHNEISLALVPPDHAVIPPANLEAEAHGLLDRALGVLQENHRLAFMPARVEDVCTNNF